MHSESCDHDGDDGTVKYDMGYENVLANRTDCCCTS